MFRPGTWSNAVGRDGEEDHWAVPTALLKCRHEIIDHNWVMSIWGFGREKLSTVSFIYPQKSLPGIQVYLGVSYLMNRRIHSSSESPGGGQISPACLLNYVGLMISAVGSEVFPVKVKFGLTWNTRQCSPTGFHVIIPLYWVTGLKGHPAL